MVEFGHPRGTRISTMAPMRIELFGGLRIFHGGRQITSVNTNRLQSLLAYLVLQSDAPQSRERLAFLLWPESSETQARTNLRQLLHHLRRALPVDCQLLMTENQSVQWRRDSGCAIDVLEFQAAAGRAAEANKRGDLSDLREALETAALLYQDDLLPGLFDEWLSPKREELRRSLAAVLSRLSALLESGGDYPAAIRRSERLIALDPLSEPYYQALMRLHALNQDRSSALRVYHQLMRELKRELGVSPGKATQELFTQILKSETAPAPRVEAPSYAVKRAPMVGRSREWETLLDCWRRCTQGDTRMALVLGEPGIGKSRLADELYHWLAERREGAAARARCYIAHGQLAYAPVAEWLRSEALRQAPTRLSKPQLTELARVLPEILTANPDLPPPQPLTESWQRRHFYESLNAALHNAGKPLLLLIDDLQWCDRDSFEWLDSLFRSEPSGAILILATAAAGRNRPGPSVDSIGRGTPAGRTAR